MSDVKQHTEERSDDEIRADVLRYTNAVEGIGYLSKYDEPVVYRLAAGVRGLLDALSAARAERDAAQQQVEAVEKLCDEAERIAAAVGRDITDEGYPAWVEAEKLRDALAAAALSGSQSQNNTPDKGIDVSDDRG